MKTHSDQSLSFMIGKSRFMILFLLIIHLLSVIACLLSGLSINYQVILVLVITVSLFKQLSDYNETNGGCLKYDGIGDWKFASDCRVSTSIDISGATVLTSLLTVLYFKQENRKKTLVIFKDAMTGTEYRKLKAALKMSGMKTRNHNEI